VLREIVLDTETTGLDPAQGDRLIEIGCIELINRIPTGREFHSFLNPEPRQVHPQAEAIHGISTAFLRDKPTFDAITESFLSFIGDAPLVIHNAAFDVGFLNTELERLGRAPIAFDRIVESLALARRKHPAGPNSLDALCKRYGIDNTQRTKHGALIDSLLLARVYVELLGERQASLGLLRERGRSTVIQIKTVPARSRPQPLPSRLSDEDVAAHLAFVRTLGPHALWSRYLETTIG